MRDTFKRNRIAIVTKIHRCASFWPLLFKRRIFSAIHRIYFTAVGSYQRLLNKSDVWVVLTGLLQVVKNSGSEIGSLK